MAIARHGKIIGKDHLATQGSLMVLQDGIAAVWDLHRGSVTA